MAAALFQVFQHCPRSQPVQRCVSFIENGDGDVECLGVVVGLDLHSDAFDALGILETVEVEVDAVAVEWVER